MGRTQVLRGAEGGGRRGPRHSPRGVGGGVFKRRGHRSRRRGREGKGRRWSGPRAYAAVPSVGREPSGTRVARPRRVALASAAAAGLKEAREREAPKEKIWPSAFGSGTNAGEGRVRSSRWGARVCRPPPRRERGGE